VGTRVVGTFVRLDFGEPNGDSPILSLVRHHTAEQVGRDLGRGAFEPRHIDRRAGAGKEELTHGPILPDIGGTDPA
jgi:hypothetical protein